MTENQISEMFRLMNTAISKISNIEKDVSGLKSDVAELKEGQSRFEAGQARLEKEIKSPIRLSTNWQANQFACGRELIFSNSIQIND